jgi:hypothetical protein
MEKKLVSNRVSYEKAIPAEKVGEMKRLTAAAAAVVGSELADSMRMHAESERIQASAYFEVSDDDGGTYSVSVKTVKLSQTEKMTRTRAASIAASEFANYLVSLATNNPTAMAVVATKAVAFQSAYADYLLAPVPSGEKRKSATEFFAEMLKQK